MLAWHVQIAQILVSSAFSSAMCVVCAHTVLYCMTLCVPDFSGCLLQGGLTAFFYAVQNSQIEAMRVLVNEFNCSPSTSGGVSKIGNLITHN